MRRARFALVTSIAVALPLAFAACKQEAQKPAAPPLAAPAPKPFAVSTIELGNAIGSDKRVSLAKTTFAPTDTIYASIVTDGQTPSATLNARWTYGDEGQLVKEDSLSIAPTGPATNEFHIAKPDGWPAGKYRVSISVDGIAAGSMDFEVVAP